nr:hypothetical protein [uncultured Carboxylicivirga sp.]
MKLLKKTALLSFILIIGVGYGFIMSRYHLFPYGLIQKVYYNFSGKSKGPWSIGIYTGDSPFVLQSSDSIQNPIITVDDIDDVDGVFVADPFLLVKDSIFYIYFEVLNRETMQGDIAYAFSQDLKKWQYGQVVLDEEFHLSYPNIFQCKGEIYMVPESNEAHSVRLYKATGFPDKFEYVENLLEGYQYDDPNVFYYNKKWWMFVSKPEHDVMHLYYSSELMGEWKLHPQSPIRQFDKKYSGTSGRIFTSNGKLYRLAQDCEEYYGKQVYCFEIDSLTTEYYHEKLVGTDPLFKKGRSNWNNKGVHHADIQHIDDRWFAIIDGQKKE